MKNLQPSSKPIENTLTSRDGFGQAMLELGKANRQIVALCADLNDSLRLTKFEKELPHQFIQVGVAEQNLAGVAAGLALGGKIPFAASFAVFNPGRNWEQIRASICYSNLNVKIVGGHAGLSNGGDGATHQALEDIALMRALPNMIVVVPCDANETIQATKAIANHLGPSYLRINKTQTENITPLNSEFKIGKSKLIKEGSDITIIACGIMVEQAIIAANKLEKIGKSVRIINMHTIKPIDTQAILIAALETKLIITAEEHQKNGGLGSAVAEVISENMGTKIKQPIPVIRVGVDDQFGQSGSIQELLKKYKIDAQEIVLQSRPFT